MKKIVIDEKTNLVENIIIADDTFILPDKTLIDYVDGVNIGDIFKDGKLEKDTTVEIEQLKIQAKYLLEKSDMVALRCLKNNVLFNDEWVKFDTELRLVVKGELFELPEQPKYPEGT